MVEKDPDKLADQLEREGEKLEDHSAEVGQSVEDARQDWQHKRRDGNVPGAPPPPANDDEG